MTLKEVVLESVERLLAEGKREFTTSEVYEKVLEIDPSKKRRSILATLSGLTVGRKHRVYTEKDQFLAKVKYGVYKVCWDD
jgi:hypothetical protein